MALLRKSAEIVGTSVCDGISRYKERQIRSTHGMAYGMPKDHEFDQPYRLVWSLNVRGGLVTPPSI